MYNETKETTPAEIIREQLGGRFLFLIGAREFVSQSEGQMLRFRIARNESRISHIEIELDPSDTYNVFFVQYNSAKLENRIVSKYRDVYVEDLHTLIEENTTL